MEAHFIKIITSGGQTGADRAGLDFAKSMGIATGGWCPRGRRAEDGQVPPEYPLRETQTSDYRDRTQKNVEDSDGTIVFIDGSLNEESGSALTIKICKRYGRPCLFVNFAVDKIDVAAHLIREFLRDHEIKILNIAGSRASISPGIGQKVFETLKLAFSGE